MRLAEIHIHPLKSCRSNLVSSALVEAMGLQHDRRWMLVSDREGFLTGRQYPRMVLITASMDDRGVTFDAPGMDSLRVEIADMREWQGVTVWQSGEFAAQVGSDEADFWFSDFLGANCRLVYTGADSTRRTRRDPEVPVSFADGYPVLLIGTASLEELNGRLVQPVSMRHFRPNLVVETSVPFIEDSWRHIRIGGVVFENLKPCSRCLFTTVDPDTATPAADRQPLETLNNYRRTEDGTMFGVNLVARSLGRLQLGDAVELV
ncbi:MOSC domain-containing protein [Chitinimonas viridis]|uniref:MOSC domain-containing protein n=1 Tax=Chitinimonas viridis TaxID=664880 RepID=A0ABT8B478_9NEIS|nr:MOSC domain-containing protein [Chitinimonas viridis]MDN3577067.1 MOSC domain-containing protein [Chitinimonas viridis]